MDLDHLRWLAGETGGVAWLGALPTLIADCVDRWSLRLATPYADAHVSFTAAATTPDGVVVVLKIQFPHPECEHEGDALRRWDGDGAVRLLAEDPERHALLLEHCDPGVHLGTRPEIALDVMVDLLRRLAVSAAAPFRSLTAEAAMWVEHLGEPRRTVGVDPVLVDAAVGLLRELSPPTGDAVLLHQDLHGDNVLAATRAPWLAIDPKPLVGDRAFAVAPVVRSFELGDSRDDVLHRLDRLTADLGLDRERARGWTVGQTIAWTGSGEHGAWCQQVARWLLER